MLHGPKPRSTPFPPKKFCRGSVLIGEHTSIIKKSLATYHKLHINLYLKQAGAKDFLNGPET
jgi:hypothetical protein